MSAKQLYEAGKLAEAITAIGAEVKAAPTDTGKRGFLIELLCYAGEHERADNNLNSMGNLNPEAMVGVALLRELVRADQSRKQFFTEGRAPEFLNPPTGSVKLRLEAAVVLRAGDKQAAAELLAQAEECRVKPTGTLDGEAFDDFRDLDDLTADVVEVLTSNGKYYWVPTEHIESMEFHKPERPLDLLWRRCHMIVRGGPDGEVYVPSIYVGTTESSDEKLKLGRGTDWLGAEGEPVRGLGLRTYLVGEADKTILQLGEMEFPNATATAAEEG